MLMAERTYRIVDGNAFWFMCCLQSILISFNVIYRANNFFKMKLCLPQLRHQLVLFGFQFAIFIQLRLVAWINLNFKVVQILYFIPERFRVLRKLFLCQVL